MVAYELMKLIWGHLARAKGKQQILYKYAPWPLEMVTFCLTFLIAHVPNWRFINVFFLLASLEMLILDDGDAKQSFKQSRTIPRR